MRTAGRRRISGRCRRGSRGRKGTRVHEHSIMGFGGVFSAQVTFWYSGLILPVLNFWLSRGTATWCTNATSYTRGEKLTAQVEVFHPDTTGSPLWGMVRWDIQTFDDRPRIASPTYDMDRVHEYKARQLYVQIPRQISSTWRAIQGIGVLWPIPAHLSYQ